MAVPEHYSVGIISIIYKLLVEKNVFFSIYPTLSCVLWSSFFILLFVAFSGNRTFLQAFGNRGIFLALMCCMLLLFFPIDIPQQKIVSATILQPLGRVLNYRLGGNITVAVALMYVWVAGSIVCAVVFVTARCKMNLLLKRLPMKELDVPETAARLLPKRTRVFVCFGVSVPMSIGVRRRMILLPDKAFDETEICNIIRHEAVHLKLFDHITVLFTEVLCIIYWWNPCVYLLKRSIEKNLEIRCDRVAVRELSREELASYMQTILKVFKNRYGGAYTGLGLLGSRRSMEGELRDRFKVLEMELAGKRYWGVNILITGLVIGGMFFSYGFVLTPFYMPRDDAPVVYSDDLKVPEELTAYPSFNDESYADMVVVDETSYIKDYGDGLYVIYSKLSSQVISPEMANVLIEEGVRLEEEVEGE